MPPYQPITSKHKTNRSLRSVVFPRFTKALISDWLIGLTAFCTRRRILFEWLRIFQPITSKTKPHSGFLAHGNLGYVLSQFQVRHSTCLAAGKWLSSTYWLIRKTASFMIGYIVDQSQVKEKKPWHTSFCFPVPYARYRIWLWVLIGWLEPTIRDKSSWHTCLKWVLLSNI